MKQILLAALCLFNLAAFAQDQTVITDPNVSTRVLNGSFSAISVSDGVELYLTQGSSESIAVSAAEQKYMDRFKTVVENGTLKIYYDTKGIHWTGNEKRKLKAYVSFIAINKLTGAGGADVAVNGKIEVAQLDMKFTSGSVFNGAVATKTLGVDQNSGSEVTISGKSEKINVDVSSGAIFKGYDLAVDYCDAKASSGAGVRITINKELNAKANSGGGIRYKGEGLIREVNVNSGGIVKRG